MREFPTFEHRDDRQKLHSFVVWVRDFLAELVDSQTYDHLFYTRLRRPMREAWREVQPEVNTLIETVGEIDNAQMVRHGLGGFQLTFKLETVRELSRSFRRAVSRRGLRRLLEGIDTLLESILEAKGAGSAFSEIKETIQNCIKADPAV